MVKSSITQTDEEIVWNDTLYLQEKELAPMTKWKDVVGYEDLYEVSSDGDVFSLGRVVYDSIGRTRHIKPKKLNPSKTNAGYLEVRLTDENGKSKNHLIHRLVAEAFIENPDNKEFVNHIDGVKTNNLVTNLEWTTCGENNTHAYETGLRKDSR